MLSRTCACGVMVAAVTAAGCANTVGAVRSGDLAGLGGALQRDAKTTTDAVMSGDLTGPILGAGAGVLVASALGGGDYKRLQLIGGGVVGALLGRYAQGRLKGDEPEQLAARQADVLVNGSDGESVAWSGERSDTTAMITATETRSERRDLAIARDKRVEAPEDLMVLGNTWQIQDGTQLRAGPDGSAEPLGTLAKGDLVQVMGSVAGGRWLLVERDRRAVGYAEAAAVRLAPPEAQAPAVVRSEPIDMDALSDSATVADVVTASTTCRTVRTEIGGDADALDSCKGADGAWEL